MFEPSAKKLLSEPMLYMTYNTQDNKVHGANMGPTWVLSAPDGPHVGHMNLAIRDHMVSFGHNDLNEDPVDMFPWISKRS